MKKRWAAVAAAIVIVLGACDHTDADRGAEATEGPVPTQTPVPTDTPVPTEAPEDSDGADGSTDDCTDDCALAGSECELAQDVCDAEPMDWGTVPADLLQFTVVWAGDGPCAEPETGSDEITFDFFASGRGLAANTGTTFDGTFFFGEGTTMYTPRLARITRDDVETTEWDSVTLVFNADGSVSGEWLEFLAPGDLDDPNPDIAEVTECGLFDLDGPLDQLVLIRDTAPATDMAITPTEGWVCTNTPEGLLVSGAAPGLPPGSSVEVSADISSTEFVELGTRTAITDNAGHFDVLFEGESADGNLSMRARHGVYSMGGFFASSCDGG